MPLLDKPITSAEYYSRQYDKGKRARDKASYELYQQQKASEIAPGQPLYLEVKSNYVSKDVLSAPDVKAKTGITVNPREIFRPKSNVETYTEQTVSQRSKVGQAYSDVNTGISGLYTSQVRAPVTKFYAEKKSAPQGRTLLSLRVPGGRKYLDFLSGAESYVAERPADIITSFYGYRAAKYVITSSPGISSVLGSTKGKVLMGGLLGIYGVETVKSVRTADNPSMQFGEETVKFTSMLGGFGSGKFNPKSASANVKVKPVVRVEGFKTVSRNVEFNSLNIGSYYGKPLAFTGRSKTSGAGLFRVDNKFFRVISRERGFSRNVNDNRFMRSTATLDVQPYSYGLGGKQVPSGKLFKSRMTSEQVVFPSNKEGVFNIRGMSIFNAKGSPRVTRLVSGKASISDDSSIVRGFNVDTFRGKAIKGSLKEVKGFYSTQVESPIGDMTYSISKGYLFGRTPGRVSVERSNVKSIPSFRREEFIRGSQESVFGLKSPSVQSSISEQSVKGVVSNAYRLNVAEQRFNVAKSFPKTVSVSKSDSVRDVGVRTSRSSSSSASRSSFAFKREPIVKSASVSKSLLGVSSRSSLKPSSILRQAPSYSLRQSPFSDSAIKSVTRTATRQSQKTETRQILRQTFSTRGVTSFAFREPTMPMFALPSPSIKVNPINFLAKSSKSKALFKESYAPSIEASFFNIRAKSTNVQLGGTGLVLRPILV